MKRRRPVAPTPPHASKARAHRSPDALIDPKVLQELIDIFHSAGVADLEIERQGLRVRLRRVETSTAGTTKEFLVPVREPQRSPAASELPPVLSPAEGLLTVRSPIVGVFYRSASLDTEPYVEEGAYVTKGQVLCIVEAMKLMNEIESEVDGRVVKILQENAKPVEYGEPLFLIEPGSRAEG
jgi:acetyl-CoA carboxylase biotin carboxyl carrier protein